MNLPTFPVQSIHTERLVLRQWIDSDREPWAALNADAETMRYFPKTLTRAETDAAADRFSARIDANGWGLWALEREGEFIGFTGLAVPAFDAPFLPGVEIGWRLARSAWGNGYATEAARAALAFGFDRLGLDEIVSFTAVANQRSRSVMERLGMTRDESNDFEHPSVPEGNPLRTHVLYRLQRPTP